MKISIAMTMMICESYASPPPLPFFSVAETLRGSFFDQRSSVLRSAVIPPVETRHLRRLVTQRLKKGAYESLTTGQRWGGRRRSGRRGTLGKIKINKSHIAAVEQMKPEA